MTEPWDSQMQALGAFIRSKRKLANLSLRQLAERTKLSNPYLSQIERGLHQPSVRVIRLISDALNVSTETLLAQAGLLHRDQSGDWPARNRHARHRGGHQGRAAAVRRPEERPHRRAQEHAASRVVRIGDGSRFGVIIAERAPTTPRADYDTTA